MVALKVELPALVHLEQLVVSSHPVHAVVRSNVVWIVEPPVGGVGVGLGHAPVVQQGTTAVHLRVIPGEVALVVVKHRHPNALAAQVLEIRSVGTRTLARVPFIPAHL